LLQIVLIDTDMAHNEPQRRDAARPFTKLPIITI